LTDEHETTLSPRLDTPPIWPDVKRPGKEIIDAMQKEKVYIGRVWPSWPTYVRVSIGTQDEMNKSKAVFLKVMA